MGKRSACTRSYTALRSPSFARQIRRDGVVTLELIAAIPLFLIAAISILELGSIVGAMNQVALAARNGALAAAKSPGSSITIANATLSTAGISTSGVTVTEHFMATSVKVTVEAPLPNMCRDFLSSFGFTLNGKTATVATVMPLNP